MFNHRPSRWVESTFYPRWKKNGKSGKSLEELGLLNWFVTVFFGKRSDKIPRTFESWQWSIWRILLAKICDTCKISVRYFLGHT